MGSFSLNSNISELPAQRTIPLAEFLSRDDLWTRVACDDPTSPFYVSPEEIHRYRNMPTPGEAILRVWGTRGQTVMSFMERLQRLALTSDFGKEFDIPQLILRRKFKPVRWSNKEEIVTDVIDNRIHLECKGVGFPAPTFQWECDGKPFPGANKPILTLQKCRCQTQGKFRCVVSNEIPRDFSFTPFYHRPGKQTSSCLVSKEVEVSHLVGNSVCELCKTYPDTPPTPAEPSKSDSDRAIEELIAADKVALIISNCSYENQPKLLTPLCDAQVLADALMGMQYKTVCLANLRLSEMKKVVQEYKRLLGAGVYAVFFYVGHGYEVNGQCYLLPIDAPEEEEAFSPEFTVSMDWILMEFSHYDSALNLLLLDMCRRPIPIEKRNAFIEYAETFNNNRKPNRNTVYGYSTSGGIGSYEILHDNLGIFMTYLKDHVSRPVPVTDMLNRVLSDVADAAHIGDRQIPEVRTSLSRPRSLCDRLSMSGHTVSYHLHTRHWETMHELPYPVTVPFKEMNLMVTIWFQFCGHFTNKVYVMSSVSDFVEPDAAYDQPLSDTARNHLAYLKFAPEFEVTNWKVLEHDEEGTSLTMLLSHLQRTRGDLHCEIELQHRKNAGVVVATRPANLGRVLITRITENWEPLEKIQI